MSVLATLPTPLTVPLDPVQGFQPIPSMKGRFRSGSILQQCRQAIIVERKAQQEDTTRMQRTPLDIRIEGGTAAGAFVFQDIVTYAPGVITPIDQAALQAKGKATIAHRYVAVDGYADIGKMDIDDRVDIFIPDSPVPGYPVPDYTAKLLACTAHEIILKPGTGQDCTQLPPHGKAKIYLLRKEQDFLSTVQQALSTCPEWPDATYPDEPLPGQLDTLAERLLAGEDEPTRRAFALTISLVQNGYELAGVQGPPGTGKTYLLGLVAVWLLANGYRVGVASLSNKAVINAANMIQRTMDRFPDLTLPLYKTGEVREALDSRVIRYDHATHKEVACWCATIHSAVRVADSSSQTKMEDMRRDVLLIDEAGQVSSYLAVALSFLSKHMVLFGDQKQLPPVLRGTHKVDNLLALSAMQYLEQSRGMAWIVPLLASHRMNEGICTTVQSLFYPGLRLAAGKNRGLKLVPPPGNMVSDRDISFYDVHHRHRSSRSQEEITVMSCLIAELQQCRLSDGRQITSKDIAVLTPYRCQSRGLMDELGGLGLAGIGTVDKMQGQGAPVVIYSMTTSSHEAITTLADWLFSPNRWNVAMSRAMAKFIIVGNLAATKQGSAALWDGYQYKRMIVTRLLDNPAVCERIQV